MPRGKPQKPRHVDCRASGHHPCTTGSASRSAALAGDIVRARERRRSASIDRDAAISGSFVETKMMRGTQVSPEKGAKPVVATPVADSLAASWYAIWTRSHCEQLVNDQLIDRG